MTAPTGSVAENLANADHEQPLAAGHEAGTAVPSGHGGEHAVPTALGLDATAYVALAMLVVIVLMLWKKVPAAIGGALDRKIAGIRAQLDEASSLRAEAEALKAEYEAKSAAAAGEADAIRASAQREADALLAKARGDADALVARRAKMAEDKIGAAERDAIAQVRARAASAAAKAAAELIAETHDRAADRTLVNRAIATLN